MRLVLVDSGGANIGSVRYALQRLGVDAELTADRKAIEAADRVVLPGVGAAAPAMAKLRAAGLVETLRALDKPLLGICLGMQLLFESSEEGEVQCLGRLPGRVRKLEAGPGVRIPHMGWNRLHVLPTSFPRTRESSAFNVSQLLAGIDDGAFAYFVHSYAAPVTADCVASSEHGSAFAAVVQRGRAMGAQFHPERSAATGARLLENFLRGDFGRTDS